MSFFIYDRDSDELHDVDTSALHYDNDGEGAPLMDFLVMSPTQIKLMFDLDLVRVHQQSDGDLIITLKT